MPNAVVLAIKKSQTTDTPTSLANGELAYSYSSDKLYIGQTDDAGSVVSVEYIAGKLLVDKVANLESQITDSIVANTSGNAGTATTLASGQNFSLTGDITAPAVSFDGSAAVTLSTTIAENSVALGTDTTGNYVSGVSGTTNEIEVSHTPGEGSTATIGLPDDVTISNDLGVARDLTVTRNLHVDGNMTIEGSQTYISSSTVTIDDSALKLGANNAADTVDTGVYGLYVDSTTNKYAGYFRDASDSGKFKFYTGLQTEPTGTVDPTATGYTMGEVVAIIDGGTYSD